MNTEPMWPVPRLWPGETVVCIGGGPSLTQADVEYCRDRARVIAVNDAYKLAPWADVFYFCDLMWFHWHKEAFTKLGGLKVTLENNQLHGHGLKCIRNRGQTGLWLDPPDGVATGCNSGYQVINLAVLFGARRILLLGYDMKADASGKTHWFGDHAQRPSNAENYARYMLPHFPKLHEECLKAGVNVINCTRETAIECFPRSTVEGELCAPPSFSAKPQIIAASTSPPA